MLILIDTLHSVSFFDFMYPMQSAKQASVHMFVCFIIFIASGTDISIP